MQVDVCVPVYLNQNCNCVLFEYLPGSCTDKTVLVIIIIKLY